MTIAKGKYSAWTKGIFIVGLPLFFALALFSFWSAFFNSKLLSQASIFIVMGCGFSWMIIFSFRIIPHLWSEILVSEDGIRLRSKSFDRFFSWAGLKHYRNRTALQVIEIYDNDGNRILTFDYYLSGFGDVYSSISKHLPRGA